MQRIIHFFPFSHSFIIHSHSSGSASQSNQFEILSFIHSLIIIRLLLNQINFLLHLFIHSHSSLNFLIYPTSFLIYLLLGQINLKFSHLFIHSFSFIHLFASSNKFKMISFLHSIIHIRSCSFPSHCIVCLQLQCVGSQRLELGWLWRQFPSGQRIHQKILNGKEYNFLLL